MAEVSLLKIDELLAVLTEAARTHAVVRVYLREPDGSARPMRIVEGAVLDVADGRDGRTRARFAIPTGAGDPVECRVLVEGIEHAEVVATSEAAGTVSGPMLRPTLPLESVSPRVQIRSTPPDETSRRLRPPHERR